MLSQLETITCPTCEEYDAELLPNEAMHCPICGTWIRNAEVPTSQP